MFCMFLPQAWAWKRSQYNLRKQYDIQQWRQVKTKYFVLFSNRNSFFHSDMKQLDKIAFVENFTFFLYSSCVHLKFPEFESIGEYQKKPT